MDSAPPEAFDIDKFKMLLDRLESSKRQQMSQPRTGVQSPVAPTSIS
jgi:hypothetical protein